MNTLLTGRLAWVVAAVGLLGPMTAQAQSPSVTVTGQLFALYSYALNADSSLTPPAHRNNFDISRTQIVGLGRFSGGVTTQVGVDVDARKAASNQLSFRLKYANVAWQPGGKGPLSYKFGLMNTPWVGWEDALWDYRMQGTSAMDRNGFFTISDFGAGVDGMWDQDRVNLQAGVFNGEGFSNAPGDGGKDLESRISVRLMKSDLPGRVGGLRVTGYAGVGTATGGGTRQRFVGMVSYRSKLLTLAAELATTRDSTSSITPKQHGAVMTAFGVINLPNSKLAVIGRVDTFDPNTDSTATAAHSAGNLAVNRQTRVIAGVSYTLSPNLRVLFDADLNSVENGATNSFDQSRHVLFFHTEVKF